MHHIKSFLFVITGFFIVITLFSLLMPSTVMIAKTQSIPAEKSTIMGYVNEPTNWKKWYPELKNEEVQFSDKAIEWQKNKIEFIDEDSFAVRISFMRNGELPVITDISLFDIDGVPQIEWKAYHKLRWYPWEKFGGMMLSDMAGPLYDSALISLKDVVLRSK